MPYIINARRHIYEEIANVGNRGNFVVVDYPNNPGELNYIITKLIIGYTKAAGINYHTLNEVTGILECVKQEFYRRIVAPYEDKKIAENGDVY